jgi:Kef-type K+ transport system membrane component KefB
MDHATHILMSLFIVFLAAQVGSEIAQRLKMPSVVGQIAAGAAIGPSALAWAAPNEVLLVLSEIGAIFLLFSVGLETKLGDLRQVGKVAFQVAILGVIVPFVLGAGWAITAGFVPTKAAFVAAAFVATSAGITARVLQEIGVLSRLESRVILGAAIIDDVLAMLVLGVVTTLQTGGVDLKHIVVVLIQAIVFLGVVAVLGAKVMRRSSDLLALPLDPESPLAISLAICFGLAVAAAHIGLAAIIGAFLAGMILAETNHHKTLERDIKPILALMLPFFFVVTGMQVDLQLLANWNVIGVTLLVTALAVAAKIIGCGFGARSLGKRSAFIVGIGMVPRGEVGIIVATLGKQAGVFDASIYAIIIAMSLLTSMIAPPLLKMLFRNAPPDPEPEPPEPPPAQLVPQT